jgi:hypothetical protein
MGKKFFLKQLGKQKMALSEALMESSTSLLTEKVILLEFLWRRLKRSMLFTRPDLSKEQLKILKSALLNAIQYCRDQEEGMKKELEEYKALYILLFGG